MKSRNQGLKLYTSIIAIVFTAVSTAQLSSIVALSGDITNNVYAKYSNDQAQSFVNECGLDGVTGINCGNNGPLMQGAGLASSPVITQFGGEGGQRGTEEPTEPTPPTEFTVKGTAGDTFLTCPDGVTRGTNLQLEFSAEGKITDESATGIFKISDGTLSVDGTVSEGGVSEDNSFFVSGLASGSLCGGSPTDIEIGIFGNCGDFVTITYEEPSGAEATLTGDVECTLT